MRFITWHESALRNYFRLFGKRLQKPTLDGGNRVACPLVGILCEAEWRLLKAQVELEGAKKIQFRVVKILFSQ